MPAIRPPPNREPNPGWRRLEPPKCPPVKKNPAGSPQLVNKMAQAAGGSKSRGLGPFGCKPFFPPTPIGGKPWKHAPVGGPKPPGGNLKKPRSPLLGKRENFSPPPPLFPSRPLEKKSVSPGGGVFLLKSGPHFVPPFLKGGFFWVLGPPLKNPSLKKFFFFLKKRGRYNKKNNFLLFFF